MADGSDLIARLSDDPHRVWAELREHGEAVRLADLGGVAVIGHAACSAVMRDADTFTVDDPRFTTARVIGPSMLSTDGTAHTRHREPFVVPYRRDVVDRRDHSGLVELARTLVGDVRDGGGGDLRSRVAAPLAVDTVLASLDMDVDGSEVLGWYRRIVASVQDLSANPDAEHRDGVAAHEQLAEAITATARNGSWLGDVFDRSGLTDDEVVSNVAVVMFGAIETSEGAIATALLDLFTRPGLLAMVTTDPSSAAQVADESMRLEPAAANVDRYTTRPTRIADLDVDVGEYVHVSLAAANRDPAVFASPDEFNPSRHNLGRQLTFAHGPHACIGRHLARLEVEAALVATADLLADHSLASDSSTRATGLVFRKPERVIVTR